MKRLDFHVHMLHDISIKESAEYFTDMCRRKGHIGVGIMAISVDGDDDYPNCNEDALLLREIMPNSYAFASLHHDRDFVEQTKKYMSDGFNGIKLLEGKPSLYRRYGYGFDHPRFEPFFAYAEEQGIPLVIHNNDPAMHWDKSKMSERAISKGWYYDDSIPPHEYYFKVFEDILERHPQLRVAVAHAGFYSNDLDRAERLLDKYPNFMLDMTPAPIIFQELSETPEHTEAFLHKYHERLIYGTDAENLLTEDRRELNDRKTALMDAFYEGTGIFTEKRYTVRGFDLPKYILEDIYYNNAMRFMKMN